MGSRPIRVLEVGDVLRDSRDRDPVHTHLDGFVNLYAATNSPGHPGVPLAAGINPIKRVAAPDGPRIPAILIASSPHKHGSLTAPWQDFFDSDNGYIRYHGDAKRPGVDPSTTTGNRVLLEARDAQHAADAAVRRTAAPLIFFQKVPQGGRVKGFAKFQGFGIISRAERITQFNQATGSSFANYSFDCLVLGLEAENEQFDWNWITLRRDPTSTIAQTEHAAPRAWREWVRLGPPAAGRVRRRVSKLDIQTEDSQRQLDRTRASALKQIYRFYEGRKQRFELLAYHVTARVLGTVPKVGGVTQGSADWGIDFIARLDVGSGSHFGRAKLIVLGQAKCENPDGTTNANDIARTVARLRRGWIGAYVTTAAVTRRAQREVIEDRYPIVLINGDRLAEEVVQMAHEAGVGVRELLTRIDEEFPAHIPPRDPEELLRE